MDLNSYVDAGSVSSWAAEAVRWAVASGLISGVSSNTLAPQGTILRSETAAMLQRLLAPTF